MQQPLPPKKLLIKIDKIKNIDHNDKKIKKQKEFNLMRWTLKEIILKIGRNIAFHSGDKTQNTTAVF